MIKMHLSYGLSALLVFSSLPNTLSAQQPAPAATLASAPMAAPHGADRRLSLDVVVTDGSGKPISGLTQQDFAITDNKKPRAIVSFHAADRTLAAPDPVVEVILVLDTYNAELAPIARERQGITKFLNQNGGHLAIPVTLVVVTGTGIKMTNHPSQNGTAIINYMNQTPTAVMHSIPNAGGFYAALEKENVSLDTLRALTATDAAKRPGRKLLIWIGPGWPIITSQSVMQQLSKKQEDKAFEAIVVTSNALRQARITLYEADSITLGSIANDAVYKGYLKAATSGKDAVFGDLALQVIVTQTGGKVIDAITDLNEELNTCIADANAFYTLTFDAPPAEHPDEYHALTVTAAKPGLTARTLTGYYSQP